LNELIPVFTGPCKKSAESGLKETARLEAFSDGVFAIAITPLQICQMK